LYYNKNKEEDIFRAKYSHLSYNLALLNVKEGKMGHRSKALRILTLLALLLALVPARHPVQAAEIWVRNSGGAGRESLRVAIIDANDNPGPDLINFDIPTSDPGYICVSGNCWWTIDITTPLPELTGGYTLIDGFTQMINQGDTNPLGPEIEINGSFLGGTMSILTIESDQNVVQGFAFHSAPGPGVRIITGAASNTLYYNYIGTSPTGRRSGGEPDLGNLSGVEITSGAHDNTITECVISDNTQYGVLITGSNSDYNEVKRSKIGMDASGEAALGNGWDGIAIQNGSSSNRIGGVGSEGNVISGNILRGVYIYDADSDGNDIKGNKIGVTQSGSSTPDVGNLLSGVMIASGAADNWITDNLISGNHDHGVYITGSGSDYNYVRNNLIGTDPSGLSLIPNHHHGVAVYDGASSNEIGDLVSPSNGHVVAGNGWSGIAIVGSNENNVYHNAIGTAPFGTAIKLGNVFHGVAVVRGSNNTIGKNHIAHNGRVGVLVQEPTAIYNTITQNSIHDHYLDGIWLDNANHPVSKPIMTMATCTSVEGVFSDLNPNPTIEIFSDYWTEGRIYEGTATISSEDPTHFTWSGNVHGPHVTATLTDENGNTSEFSAPPIWNACVKIYLPVITK
jgi:parallel beta-helix repeat protein